ncbi:MAG TPA: restriction endonuclease [Thermoanaerobaculia bacterium]|nr:restriction endonuclease [Thermoanaerobaculia bacterium]
MITTKSPATWRDLQNAVARILSECGFIVEVEKRITTARGRVEVDVYAQEIVQGRSYEILCECKHWKRAVPQTAIHSFRTVIAEIGANVGYFISLHGFQAGAFAASELTNIQLVTWNQFQEAFEETWRERYFSPMIEERLDPLLTYTEPLAPDWFVKLPESEKAEFIHLKERYDPFGFIMMSLTSYFRIFNKEPLPKLPLEEHIDPRFKEAIPHELLIATGYREFFDLAIRYGDIAISEFRAIRDRNGLANDSPHE